MNGWVLDLMNRTSPVLDLELSCSENLAYITSSVRKIKTNFGGFLRTGLHSLP